jgi:hypothetical protein
VVGIKCKIDNPETLAMTQLSKKLIAPTYLYTAFDIFI